MSSFTHRANRRHGTHRTISGFGLIEVLVAMGVSAILLMAVLGIQQTSLKTQTQSTLTFQAGNIRTLLQNAINSPVKNGSGKTAWINTIESANNPNLACLSPLSASSCTSAGGAISYIYDANGAQVFPPLSAANSGYTTSGTSCTGFSPTAGSGNDNCPLGYQISWTPICGTGTTCTPPNVQPEITIQAIYNPKTSSKMVAFNAANYSGKFIQGQNTDNCWQFDPLTGDVYTMCTAVGIGTTAPTSTLETIAAGVPLLQVNDANSYSTLSSPNDTDISGNAYVTAVGGADSWTQINPSNASSLISARGTPGAGSAGWITFLNAPAGAPAPIAWNTRMVIDPNGNVGIGVTAPGAPLQVNSTNTNTNSAAYYGTLDSVNVNPSTASSAGIAAASSIATYSSVADNSAGSIFGTQGYANNGNTATVGTAFGGFGQVQNQSTGGFTSATGMMGAVTNQGGGTIGTAMGLFGGINNTSGTISNSYELYLNTGNSGTITNQYGVYQADAASNNYFAGNVGIGTTATPLNTLQVGSNIVFIPNDIVGAPIHDQVQIWSPTSNDYLILSSTPGSAMISSWKSTPGSQGVGSPVTGAGAGAGGNLLLQSSAGNVGIGNTSPGFTLDVFGDINSSTCVRVASAPVGGSCSSDERLKSDIHPFDLGLDALLGISPKYYKYNGLGGIPKSDHPILGVIAQEVEKTAPELIETKKVKLHPDDRVETEIKEMNYTALIYVVINAIKDLYHRWMDDSQAMHQELASVKTESAAKDQKINKLEQENTAIKAYLCGKDPGAAFCH